eukprot:1693206-Lingulodinium_polyedra.AAC.1
MSAPCVAWARPAVSTLSHGAPRCKQPGKSALALSARLKLACRLPLVLTRPSLACSTRRRTCTTPCSA